MRWITGKYINPAFTEALPITIQFYNCYACEQERPRVEALLLTLDDKDPNRELMLELLEGCQLSKLRALLDELEGA